MSPSMAAPLWTTHDLSLSHMEGASVRRDGNMLLDNVNEKTRAKAAELGALPFILHETCGYNFTLSRPV